MPPYDLVEREGRLWFAVGDVSGKGLGAALFMAITLTLFRASVETEADPAAILSRMNRTLSHNNDRLMFVTVFVAVLDLASGRAIYANGGHNPPYVQRAGGGLEGLPNAAAS